MEAYLDAVDLWEAVEDDYDIPLILDNQRWLKSRITRKGKPGSLRQKLAYLQQFQLQSSPELSTITTLENTKDLSKITLAELLNSLQAQEQWMVMRQEATVDEALPAKHEDGWRNKKKKNRKHQQANGEAAVHRSNKNKAGSSKGKYPPCKHCDRTSHSPFKCWKRPDAKCNKCNQLGHEAIICKNQNQQQDTDAQIANEDENDHLFVVTCFLGSISSDSWLIDSGCTNHMTHDKELFKELKPTRIARVWISHGGHIPTKGIGTVAIATHLGTKVIDDVLYVPEIVV
ncbi:hypothetical protein CK203_010073 [Vitis vinifera]|uniref:Retrovirus-related Pol polyprotein from transposon TNT 1-94-like beta-barrel domain-containing protein n=1 Tax=Vitis vinifera TaxID=29760 RepID=A0A438JY29_VITVI|nr:hypothetical protein CK203_010073 [Vitis vinifera]